MLDAMSDFDDTSKDDGSAMAGMNTTARGASPPRAPPLNTFVEEDGVVDVQSLLRSSLDNIGVARVPAGGRGAGGGAGGRGAVMLSSPRKTAGQRFREAHHAVYLAEEDDGEPFSDDDGSGVSVDFV